MPSFSLKDCEKYWYEYRDPMIYRVVIFMLSVENWTFDGNDGIEAALAKLGTTLDNIGNIDLQQEDSFIKFLAYIKAPRMLRIMQALDAAYPGAASKLLMHAEKVGNVPDSPASLFLRRNVGFERMRLLGRVFNPARFELIQKALAETDHA